jgi:hypothetical protein
MFHMKFRIHSSNGPLNIAAKPKGTLKFPMASITFYKKSYLDKSCIFFKIRCHTPLQNLTLRGASVAPTSQVRYVVNWL